MRRALQRKVTRGVLSSNSEQANDSTCVYSLLPPGKRANGTCVACQPKPNAGFADFIARSQPGAYRRVPQAPRPPHPGRTRRIDRPLPRHGVEHRQGTPASGVLRPRSTSRSGRRAIEVTPRARARARRRAALLEPVTCASPSPTSAAPSSPRTTCRSRSTTARPRARSRDAAAERHARVGQRLVQRHARPSASRCPPRSTTTPA